VPSLVGLLGTVLVAAPPQCPGAAVRLVVPGLGDSGDAELTQKLRRGISSSMLALLSAVRCQAATTARNTQARILITVQRCQGVQVVTWPLSGALTCFDSW
jgi:hypothetical protein